MAYEFDVAIVLACGINENGSLPDGPKASVDIAADLYKSRLTELIIFSGNLSYKADFTPPRSESNAMFTYAQEIGLPRDSLLKEDESKDTLGNAYFTKINYLIPMHLGKLAIILGPNHSLERVKYVFDKVLGDEYDTIFFEHNANREGETEREKKSLDVLREWLDNIPNGDHEKIHQVMLAKHPGYSPNPDEAWRNLNKRLRE